MATRRVYVVWTHPLFHELVRLLVRHPDVEWVGATADHSAAQGQIIDLRPDTILVEAESSTLPEEVMAILEASPSDMRVIRLSLTANELSVYHREHRTMGQADDLLSVILADGRLL